MPLATPTPLYGDCVLSFRVTCWLFITLPPTCFLLSVFPFQLYVNGNSYLICNRVQFSGSFHFLMWLLLQMSHLFIWPITFRVMDCHYQLVDPGMVLCVGLILPSRSCRQLPWCCIEWLSTYLVMWLPCIWITALQKLICVIKVVQYLLFFPGWPVGYWVTDLYSIILIPAYIPAHLNVEVSHLSWGQLLLKKHLLPQMTQVAFCLWDLHRGRSAGILLYHPMPASLHLGNTSLWQNMSKVNSDFWFWWHHFGWRLLGFPQLSTCWETFLSAVPS